jgi:hypothetical protein
MRVYIGLGCTLVLIGMSLLPTVSIPCPPIRLATSPPPQYQEAPVPTLAPARVPWTWEIDYARATRRAVKEKKPMLVLWTMDGCDWCKRLLREFETEVLSWVSRDMVPCRLNLEQNRQLAKDFRVSRFPTMVIIVEGKIVARREGYAKALDVHDWLRAVMQREKQRRRSTRMPAVAEDQIV